MTQSSRKSSLSGPGARASSTSLAAPKTSLGAARAHARGASMVEVIILIGVIALIAIVAFRHFGGSVSAMIAKEGDKVAKLEGFEASGGGTGLGGGGLGGSSAGGGGAGGNGGVVCVNGVCTNGNCFVAGTLVDTPSGARPIDKLHVGDLVVSKDPASGEVAPRKVLRTFVRPAQALVELTLRGDHGTDVLTTTTDHPFFVDGHGWVSARDLELGATALAEDGSHRELVAAQSEDAQGALVYNVEVEEFHTYFVGASHVWAHNACDPPGGGSAGGSTPGGGGGGSAGGGSAGSAGGGRTGTEPTFTTGSGQVLTGELATQAQTLRDQVKANVDNYGKKDVVLAGVMDTKTGQIFYGTNPRDQSVPDPLNPLLKPYVDAMNANPQHESVPGSHAEVVALNDALNARERATGRPVTQAELGEFMVDTAWLRGNTPGRMNRGDPAPFCGNCQGSIPGVINLPGNAPLRPPTGTGTGTGTGSSTGGGTGP